MALLNLLGTYQIPQVISTGLLQNQLNTILADIYARLVAPAAAGTVNTTNATPTTALTYATTANLTYVFQLAIVGRRTGGSSGSTDDSAGYLLSGLVKNIGGTASIIGSLSKTVLGEDQAAWDVTLICSSANVLIQVTGAANNNISWSVRGTVLTI
jgi:hypothetical protein